MSSFFYYQFVYFREKAFHNRFKLMHIIKKEWDILIPTTLNVDALLLYQQTNFRDLPVLVLATGKTCVQYTLNNFFQQKKFHRYEFQCCSLQCEHFCGDVKNTHTVTNLVSHLSWFSENKSKGVGCWEKTHEIFLNAYTLVIPRVLSMTQIRSLFRHITKGLAAVLRKNKLVLVHC